jgi:hypothetical protein
MSRHWLSIVSVTKDDPPGLSRTLRSTAEWRADSGVEHLVVYAGVAPAVLPAGVRMLGPSADGIAGAFNTGLQAAEGTWVWFLNGGDAAHENLSPAWLRTLLDRTGSDLVVGTIHYDGQLQPHPLPPMRDQWPMLDSWPPHPAVVTRRDALRAIGGFSARYRAGMDFELWQRLLGAGCRADVVAVPFARFDGTGFTSRPENAGLIFRENGEILWRHQGSIWRTCARTFVGLVVRWGRALRHLLS